MTTNREEAQDLLVHYFNQALQQAAQDRTEFNESGQDEIRAIVNYIIAAAVDEIKQSARSASGKTVSRSTPGEIIQAAQSTLLQLQNEYRDNQPPFWALGVAWEAVRFAWYVAQDDPGTARDKLQLVEEAIADCKRKYAV